MLKPGRSLNPNDYRFGMNGMEKDNEVKGTGNSYTTFFRQYDPRLGRWFSMDPITHPFQSPYSAFNNNPIYYADPMGAKGEESTSGDSEPNTYQPNGTDKPTAEQREARIAEWGFGETEGSPEGGLSFKGGHINVIDYSYFTKTYNVNGNRLDISISLDIVLDEDPNTYEIVQTYYTNQHVRNHYPPKPPDEKWEIQDMDSRKNPRSHHFKFLEDKISFGDQLYRYGLPKKPVVFLAETSILKKKTDGCVSERLITITWGFILYPDGTARTFEISRKENPSSFHLEVLEDSFMGGWNGDDQMDYRRKL